MENAVGALRVQVLRQMLKGSPALRQLVALDAVMEQMLGAREQKLWTSVPVYLERRLEHWRQHHQQTVATQAGEDDPIRWRQAGGWIADFQRDMRDMMLAELHQRLQPILGLMEAAQNAGNELNKNSEHSEKAANHNEQIHDDRHLTLGLVAVGWVGWGFVGTSWMALAMTAVIGGVYVLGALELRRFRAATATLSEALAHIPSDLSDLGARLARLHPSLQHPVRSRIEGQRVAMPGPALTPYLVGLLVMLGMLGTFLGMVTFKGAVFALEGSANLEAIRAALAAPIKGLGLAFGTSVAGVAASALLGLMSALSRRERIEVARQLDAQIATTLRPLSAAHQRDATFKAPQAQADAMPVLVDRLQSLMTGLERRSEQLDAQLLAQQQAFHREAATAYTDLAQAVGALLQDSSPPAPAPPATRSSPWSKPP